MDERLKNSRGKVVNWVWGWSPGHSNTTYISFKILRASQKPTRWNLNQSHQKYQTWAHSVHVYKLVPSTVPCSLMVCTSTMLFYGVSNFACSRSNGWDLWDQTVPWAAEAEEFLLLTGLFKNRPNSNPNPSGPLILDLFWTNCLFPSQIRNTIHL